MFKHMIWDFDGTLFDTYPVMTKAALMAIKKQGIGAVGKQRRMCLQESQV